MGSIGFVNKDKLIKEIQNYNEIMDTDSQEEKPLINLSNEIRKAILEDQRKLNEKIKIFKSEMNKANLVEE